MPNNDTPVKMRAGIHSNEQDRYERDRKRFGRRIADLRRKRRLAGVSRESHADFTRLVRESFDRWARGRPEIETATCDWTVCG